MDLFLIVKQMVAMVAAKFRYRDGVLAEGKADTSILPCHQRTCHPLQGTPMKRGRLCCVTGESHEGESYPGGAASVTWAEFPSG